MDGKEKLEKIASLLRSWDVSNILLGVELVKVDFTEIEANKFISNRVFNLSSINLCICFSDGLISTAYINTLHPIVRFILTNKNWNLTDLENELRK